MLFASYTIEIFCFMFSCKYILPRETYCLGSVGKGGGCFTRAKEWSQK